ncbi:hypothetical protein FXO38_13304 [Capsicum annuum]|nr:hypothetical protein FXO38_13304 [Capsicum annuum]
MHVAAYIGNAAFLKLSWRTKKCAAQNETKIAVIDAKSEVNPRSNFRGKSFSKSLCWHRDVRIAKKNTRAVTEKQRETSDAIENTSKAGSCSKCGLPLSSAPPGIVADVVNATVAISAATTENDSAVLVSHSVPSTSNFSCVSSKIRLGV